MALTVEGIDCYYGEAQVLHGVSLRLKPAQTLCLLGRNGAGKTTTLKAMMGLVRPRTGRIRLDATELTRLQAYEVPRHGIAYVPQGRGVFPLFTVEENLKMGLLVKGTHPRIIGRIFELFPVLESRLRQRAGSLSGGEQQMVAMARALCAEPNYLLLGELTGGLMRLLVASWLQPIRELGDRHEEPGGAEPTLQPVRVPERFLNWVQPLSLAQPLHGHQGVPVGLHPQQQAGAHRLTVQKNGAGPADAVLAPQVGAGQSEVFAEHVGQRAAHRDRDHVALPVHVERDSLLGDRLRRRDLSRANSPHRYISPAPGAGLSARPAGRCHEAPLARDAAVCSARRASAPPTCRR